MAASSTPPASDRGDHAAANKSAPGQAPSSSHHGRRPASETETVGGSSSAAQGHRDAELDEPRNLSTQRLAEIAFECLNAHGASLRPGARRWQRNGITAVMELRRRAAS